MDNEIFDEQFKETKCFTYHVDMVIQMFGKNEQEALERLNKDGGYISKRVVKLLDVVSVQSDLTKEEE